MSSADAIQIVEQDSFLVARLQGEIDLSNVRAIEAELTTALPNSARGLVVDLAAVSFMDSTGIRFLFELAMRLRQRQQELRLVVPEGSNLSRTLTLVQMPELVPLFADVVAATSGEVLP